MSHEPHGPGRHPRRRTPAIAAAGCAGLVLAGLTGVQLARADGPGTPAAPSSGSTARPAAPRPGGGPHHQPHIDGRVTVVSGDRVTVSDPDGFRRTIAVSSTTTYHDGSRTVARAAVHVGAAIHAVGTVDPDHTTLDATQIDLGAPRPPAGAPAVGKPGAAAKPPTPGGATAKAPGSRPAPTRPPAAPARPSSTAHGS